MPLQRKIPKRGFRSPFRIEFQVVNVDDLQRAKSKHIDIGAMLAAGLIRTGNRPVKVLADGDVDSALEVSAHAFSKSAVSKIEAAGGKTILL